MRYTRLQIISRSNGLEESFIEDMDVKRANVHLNGVRLLSKDDQEFLREGSSGEEDNGGVVISEERRRVG